MALFAAAAKFLPCRWPAPWMARAVNEFNARAYIKTAARNWFADAEPTPTKVSHRTRVSEYLAESDSKCDNGIVSINVESCLRQGNTYKLKVRLLYAKLHRLYYDFLVSDFHKANKRQLTVWYWTGSCVPTGIHKIVARMVSWLLPISVYTLVAARPNNHNTDRRGPHWGAPSTTS